MEKLKALVTSAQGEVKDLEKQGVRKLAFRVRGKMDAQFFALRYEAPSAVVKQIEEVLRMNETVVRYMTMRIQPSQLAASAAKAAASQAAAPKPAADQPAPPAPSAPPATPGS